MDNQQAKRQKDERDKNITNPNDPNYNVIHYPDRGNAQNPKPNSNVSLSKDDQKAAREGIKDELNDKQKANLKAHYPMLTDDELVGSRSQVIARLQQKIGIDSASVANVNQVIDSAK